MFKKICLYLLMPTLFFINTSTLAEDSKELRKQQYAAQKERQVKKKERREEVKEAKAEFREYTRELKTEYREKLKDIETEFELKRVELEANHDSKVAVADAEYQKKFSDLFMKQNAKYDEKTIERLQQEGKVFADELFSLKKQSAEEIYQARVVNVENNNKLLLDRDRLALDKASELGLTKDYAPVLATPIGSTLTKKEKRWNEKEKKAVIKLKKANRKLLSKFRNGEKLRNWQIKLMNDDFKLTWDEKSELHGIDSQQLFFNTLIMRAMLGEQFDQESFMSKIAENNKQKNLIKIKYKKIRDQNEIKRRKEKKDILSK